MLILDTVVFTLDALLDRLLDPIVEWLLVDGEVECTLDDGVLK